MTIDERQQLLNEALSKENIPLSRSDTDLCRSFLAGDSFCKSIDEIVGLTILRKEMVDYGGYVYYSVYYEKLDKKLQIFKYKNEELSWVQCAYVISMENMSDDE